MQTRFTYLPVTSLQAGQYQPRQDFNVTELQELAQSISSQGLIEPLVVRPIAKERYEIIAGERRWRAAKLAGLNEVPCLIGDYSDQQACALTLIENIQRQDLNLIEEATGYKRLIEEFHYHQDEIAALVGKSRSHVANILRLLTLTDKVKQLVRDKALSFGHARVLVGLNPEQQEMFAHQIIGEEWSVRHLEQEIKFYKNKDMNSPKNPRKDRDIERLQTILAEQVGAPVQIVNDGEDGGWLKVKFFDNDTLAGLLERLGLRYD
ncbi:TPA: ParB/RepB/Spo0J family partition protein [Legionella pneumophila]|uniref:Probable chromosome-partitioning protein ParB n=1 Tax=Legionella pneumophila TaxID=446 RepID=A0A378K7Q8_LEGPN|nr:ParB/RepB/Spo0J family partition protein [Legionella pneumophila]MCO1451886.1 ParB/RepB/Spo0J family partition protein [Legionella pneumophila]MCW8435842.1 ParB/RepB/Spo0J family partition protein [Legionella pneumophila]MCW8458583.1 ParB/RepB/Spo0J family partition protein [Legionella pneumophila]MCW8468461.1 ParB/RepB/Spo0J family partition protein [Legionella pneumophila]MCW8478132.1 ParB/RepB/Spo0J family partition protein [Legionella pneumophila]